ncbi:hypothetical protein DPMN_036643 [Dreissena polymorpha]|nr:hypothetical protein DPMN_036643 [Dreissena polymorpha]
MTINDMAVNYTQFARVYEKFTELTTSLSSKTITVGTSWSESQIQEIMDDLQNFTVTMAERNQT